MDSLVKMAASITEAQASHVAMSAADAEVFLRRIHAVLRDLAGGAGEVPGQPEASEESPDRQQNVRCASPRDSVQDTYVVCLECGERFSQLTAKHLQAHGLTPREYKKKWGFRLKDSLSCRQLQQRRSERAKQRGIPEALVKYLEGRRQGGRT